MLWSLPSRSTVASEPRPTRTMMPRITNLYAICGLTTLGGLLQGFGVSSLSAILATWQAS